MNKPVLRFLVMSDIHTKDDASCKELDRLKRGLELAKSYAAASEYKNIDALYIVGDFADNGTPRQMRNLKAALDSCLGDVECVMTLASHEYGFDGEENAKRRFAEVFKMPVNAHKKINGFHFISVSTVRGCRFDEDEREFAARELKAAAADCPGMPIFFFQHPHISGTVYGSINWGEDDLYPILMNYPQVINFSGHSHAPINDPRSIHQKHFTSLGTGSLSFFELDEFDKYYGTVPPDAKSCAQFLIAEADAEGCVTVRSADILTNSFFDCDREIPRFSDYDAFTYTNDRRLTAQPPVFDENAAAQIETVPNGVKISFPQARSADGVNSYTLTVKNGSGFVVRRISCWSGYYLKNMPEKIEIVVENLESGAYTAFISAEGFWENVSENGLSLAFDV